VISTTAQRLRVEIEGGGRLPRRGAKVEVEWVQPLGLIHAPARVRGVPAGTARTLELSLTDQPALIERREHRRVAATVEVSAWSMAEPTRLFHGRTINLSASGALLELPGLPATAALLTLRIALDPPMTTTAIIARRPHPNLAVVVFERIEPYDLDRLIGLALAPTEQTVNRQHG
jgi:hypothetical protein